MQNDKLTLQICKDLIDKVDQTANEFSMTRTALVVAGIKQHKKSKPYKPKGEKKITALYIPKVKAQEFADIASQYATQTEAAETILSQVLKKGKIDLRL